MTVDPLLVGIALLVLLMLLFRIGTKIGALSGPANSSSSVVGGKVSGSGRFVTIEGDNYATATRWVNPDAVAHFELATSEGGTWIYFVDGAKVFTTKSPEDILKLLSARH